LDVRSKVDTVAAPISHPGYSTGPQRSCNPATMKVCWDGIERGALKE